MANVGWWMAIIDLAVTAMTTRNGEPDFFSAQVSDARRFYLNLNPRQTDGLVVVSGGCEHCSADYEIHREDFQYYSVEFVSGGKGRLRIGGRDHRLHPGIAFTYGPGVRHDISTDADEPLVKYFVDFAGRRAQGLLRKIGDGIGTVVQTPVANDVMAMFEDLMRSAVRDSRFAGRICALQVESLVLRIAETAVAPGAEVTPAFATYQRCRKAISDGYLTLSSLRDAARCCHVDPAYLCRLFRRFDHQTPYQYLMRLKMAHAAELLQRPGAMVKQVAGDMRFADPYHFSRAFKRVLGIAPGEFIRLPGR